MKPGNIILLNGTSSSGKTTLAKALQRSLDEPYLHVGNDQFLHPHSPDGLIAYRSDGAGPTQAEGWLAVFEGDRFVDLRVGPVGMRWLRGMYFVMAAWSAAGNHLVADVVLHEAPIVQAAAEALHSLPAWLIRVYCPLEVAEQREQDRTERRALGGARLFYQGVYSQDVVDLTVNTATKSPEECAAQIKAHIADHPPAALRQLHQRSQALP